MNIELFNELMTPKPFQFRPEWQLFLELCEMYLIKHKIENPIVVELGCWRNRQKKFYEQILNAEHYGIDISASHSPDILGNTHDPKVMNSLKKKLKGRQIDILFIDASHDYGDVKKDFELYSPLCDRIIAFHDIESYRYLKGKKTRVWKFWDELKRNVNKGVEGYRHLMLVSLHQHRGGNMGIGMVIKE